MVEEINLPIEEFQTDLLQIDRNTIKPKGKE